MDENTLKSDPDQPILQKLLDILHAEDASVKVRVDAGGQLLAYCSRWARSDAKYVEFRQKVRDKLREIALWETPDHEDYVVEQQVRAAGMVLL